ncbi:cell division protein FtsW, lipid II flippase [Paenibacillus polysaccharolyticus]|uniref:Cell division protein FtsW, lipid II flippase n=1 Tax=Paenibacillus polysaccharolyticus TaxID=582692 RepID=A0A1G5KZP6_9BACL|nr:FtsW/RodA/SpoVE family cell cycle protein [Paenibacillus polysaccharolyticus]SCZ05558.1 cell division protein FtsW, lipid II flippase [Paenibacillus polysaccharolyticus]
MNQKKVKEQGKQKEKKEQIQNYLDQICGQVRAREVHNDLREELGNHLEEMTYDKEQEGFTTEEAATYAIEQMGDPADLGKRMHKIHRHRMHWRLLAGVVGMALVGMVLTWIYANSLLDLGNEYSSVHLLYTSMGMLAMLFCLFFDYRKWIKSAWWVYILMNVLLWITPVIADSYGSLNRMLILPFGFSIDVTTSALWILPLAIGGIVISHFRSGLNVQMIFTYVALVALPMVLIYQISDWVRLSLFGCISLLLFGWITRKWLYTLITACFCGVAAALLLLVTDQYSRFERLSVVFNLDQDSKGMGFMNNAIIDIVKTAGWWGNGTNIPIGSTLKYLYLSYPGVMLIDVFGWSACALFIVGIVWFVNTLFKILPRIQDKFGSMIVLSVTVTLALQLSYSVAIITGMVPIMSIEFPLIGYGAHVILEYAMIGLLLGVYRRKDTVSLSRNYTRTHTGKSMTLSER